MNMKSNLIRVCILLFFLSIIFSAIADVVQKDIELRYESADKRNPFIPLVTGDGRLLIDIQGEEEIDLNLEGIIYEVEGQSMAIINGEILKKNDAIGNVKIVEIRRDSVVYSKDGEIFTLIAEREE